MKSPAAVPLVFGYARQHDVPTGRYYFYSKKDATLRAMQILLVPM